VTTPLERLQQAKQTKAAETPKTPLERLMATGRRGELVELPGLGPAWLELLGARASQEVEAAVYAAMKEYGIELDAVTMIRFEIERAVRTLAIAAHDPDDHTKPFGTLAAWHLVDPTTINAAWSTYGDVRERLDPMSTPLTEDEVAAFEYAVKKKDARLLRSFGVVKLSAWLTSTAFPPSTSPTPSSPSLESPKDD